MNNTKLELRVLGTRGSVPVGGSDFGYYGGRTSCFFVQAGKTAVVFDLGTGVVDLQALLAEQNLSHAHILLSHVHYDHVMGMPYANAFFDPANSFVIYGENRGGQRIKQQLAGVIRSPYLPFSLDDLSANLSYKEITAGNSFWLTPEIMVATMASNHPNKCTLFRLECFGKKICYALDYEHNQESSQAFGNFVRGADILIYDGFFSEADFIPGWGHSTWEQGAEIALEYQVKKLLISHHGANKTDEQLKLVEASLQKIFPQGELAKEGGVFRLWVK